MSITSGLTWLGRQFTDLVLGQVDQRLEQAGQAWLAEAQALAPVDTGALRASLYYRVEGRTLTVGVGVSYGQFQEYGTRNIPPHPYVRPAMAAIGRVFGSSLEMEFNTPSYPSPVLAHQGRMIVPTGIQPRPLTQAQHRRVAANQAVSKRLHRGNVKRAKVRVRRSP